MSFSENYFSPAMSSLGSPDMVNGLILPQRHCSMAIAVLSFLHETKNSANWCVQQS